MNWTKAQYQAYEARTRRLQNPKLEPPILNVPLEPAPGAQENPSRIVVRIASYRQRLLDPDNLVGGTKYLLDGLRYAGIIPGDRPDQISLEVTQFKVKTKSEERTEIEII